MNKVKLDNEQMLRLKDKPQLVAAAADPAHLEAILSGHMEGEWTAKLADDVEDYFVLIRQYSQGLLRKVPPRTDFREAELVYTKKGEAALKDAPAGGVPAKKGKRVVKTKPFGAPAEEKPSHLELVEEPAAEEPAPEPPVEEEPAPPTYDPVEAEESLPEPVVDEEKQDKWDALKAVSEALNGVAESLTQLEARLTSLEGYVTSQEAAPAPPAPLSKEDIVSAVTPTLEPIKIALHFLANTVIDYGDAEPIETLDELVAWLEG